MSDLSMPRLQHIVASGAVAAVGVWVTYISYTQQPSEAFLFPRLIATIFVVLKHALDGQRSAPASPCGNSPTCCRA